MLHFVGAFCFGLACALAYHLYQIARTKPVKRIVASQPMPKIEIRPVGEPSHSSRWTLFRPKGVRVPLTHKQRQAILERDNFTCKYCGYSTIKDPIQPPTRRLEVDHRVSVYDGGTNEPSNLFTACLPCNQGKGKKSYYFG